MIHSKIILGAGLYGLYAALRCGSKGENVLVLEYDQAPFLRATYVNQARVHMGYHYPRSYSTAVKSAGYFDKFNADYRHCIFAEFDKIYAISADFSWTNAEQFAKFCRYSGIPCDAISTSKHFNEGMCEGAFAAEEYTYDAKLLLETMLDALGRLPNVTVKFNARIDRIKRTESHYEIELLDGERHATDYLVNTTYASVNQILKKLEYPPFHIKYEVCEIILCRVSDELKNAGITVMDGPFFSLMPFGKTGLHSLTAVTFTPHKTCHEALPTFECQARSGGSCSPEQLGNCNFCDSRPKTAWDYMSKLARKYLQPRFGFEYERSLFSMKPILKASEIDDSRPTVIKRFSESPTFLSVLSGKINTIYDLDEVLQ